MPIGELNIRLLSVQQMHYHPIPGCADKSLVYDRLIYPAGITATPEELFEEFRQGADTAIFEKFEILDGTILESGKHCKIFVAFCAWLKAKGFQRFSDLERQLPMLEIPPQVTLTGLRPYRR